MLTDKEVEHIAKLARIKLSKKEKTKIKKELSSILDYINKLNELDTNNIEPLYQTTDIFNALRADKHRKDFEMNEDLNKKLIEQAPYSEKRFIKVKSVLKK
jgi:aspartyl-tRNA(Asn)/glutamyl-tRNA(Gln) amidotransferase subunit C